jgi:hypothetical protein
MANKTPALTRAQAAFSASEQRSRMVLEQVEKERAATDAKTAKLKALRLAKEAEDKAIADQNPAPAKPRRKRIT